MATEIRISRPGVFPRVSRPVFIFSAVIIGLFILYGAAFTASAEEFFTQIQEIIADALGWYYTLVVTFFLGFVIWLLFSRFGDVRLGDPDEAPRYSYLGWFAMLFSAGMGIGLLFWSIAEPISHYIQPPQGEGESLHAAEVAMRTTYFHWGLHAWAIYIVVGLSLAYFGFRQKLPLSIRSVFYPLLGDAVYGWPGHLIDILAVFGTMFGVATSLGLGVIQVNAGLNYLFNIEQGPTTQLILIAVITFFGHPVGHCRAQQGYQAPQPAQYLAQRLFTDRPAGDGADRLHHGHVRGKHRPVPAEPGTDELLDRRYPFHRLDR